MERLEVTALEHAFGFHQVLEDINFSVQKGEVVSIVGPSGGGKSTLLNLCAGLEDLQEGSIENGFQTHCFAFQDARLFPWKTVVENIELALLQSGLCKKRMRKQSQEIALRFGLEQKDLEKYPKDLSGGMRQRVSFARALVSRPHLLFLDEPFSALDIGLKKELQNFLIDYVAKEQLSILFITHDVMEAVKLSDKILLLDKDPGKIVATYTIDTPQTKRDDTFIHNQTIAFLQEKKIIQTFELELR